MPVLSEAQVGALWLSNGGPEEAVYMAIAVANAESGRNTDAVNGASGATGLWQIHPGGAQYKNPGTNAKAAVAKYQGRKWQPWSVCGSGAWSAGEPECPKLAAEAKAIEARLSGNATLQNASVAGDVAGAIGGAASDAAGALSGAAGAASGMIDLVRRLINFVFSVFRKIADPQTWFDALKIYIGIVLLIIGIRRTFEYS